MSPLFSPDVIVWGFLGLVAVMFVGLFALILVFLTRPLPRSLPSTPVAAPDGTVMPVITLFTRVGPAPSLLRTLLGPSPPGRPGLLHLSPVSVEFLPKKGQGWAMPPPNLTIVARHRSSSWSLPGVSLDVPGVGRARYQVSLLPIPAVLYTSERKGGDDETAELFEAQLLAWGAMRAPSDDRA